MFLGSMLLHLALFGAASAQALIGNSSTTFCCNALASSGLGGLLSYPGSIIYEDSVDSYFSVLEQELTPYCIVQPGDASEVSEIVKVLVGASTNGIKCLFAVRSGGHTPWAGAANIDNGVTIDLSNLNNITFQPESNVTSIGPGATWDEVYLALEPLGQMVGGGRSSTVGVGGLSLGGGDSFYAAEIGWVCDNVRQFEVVLASGDIVYASIDENPDLFLVLKGGSSNFGIVTRFDLDTFPNQPLWGGVVVYPNSTAPQQFEAFVNFGPSIQNDPRASAIVIDAYLGSTNSVVIMNAYEYTLPVPAAPIFDDFLAIPGNISSTMRIANMSSLAEEWANPRTFRVLFLTHTFKNDIRVLNKAHDLFNSVVQNLTATASGTFSVYALYQPISPLISQQGLKKGGDVLGLDRFNETLMLYLPYLAWTGASQDALFESQGKWLNDQLAAYASSIDASNPFEYLNYADGTQHPLKSYGPANVAKMKAAASKWDPTGVFQTLVPGGFKISKVQE